MHVMRFAHRATPDRTIWAKRMPSHHAQRTLTSPPAHLAFRASGRPAAHEQAPAATAGARTATREEAQALLSEAIASELGRVDTRRA